MTADFQPQIAVDVGNSSVKFWLLDDDRESIDQCGLPFARINVEQLADNEWLPEVISTLFGQQASDGAIQWWISSVNQSALDRVGKLINRHRLHDRQQTLSSRDIPIKIDVDRPESVGTDRLLAATAVSALAPNDRSAIVVDAGSAITCDFISASGVFNGGAILPGLRMQLNALSRDTSQLPLVDSMFNGSEIGPIGKTTDAAIRAGVGLGMIGAVRELIHRITESAKPAPRLYFTGGDLEAFRPLANGDAQFLPHLLATGIALTARHLQINAKS